MSRPDHLTPEQRAWLLAHLDDSGTAADIARGFNERFGANRTAETVWRFRTYQRRARARHVYTAEQIAWLHEYAADFARTERAVVFNRRFGTRLSAPALGRKVRQLGLRSKYSGPEYDGQFRPGRGKAPGSGTRKGGNRTSFRPGAHPVTARAIGETRIDRKSGEVMVRLAEPVATYIRDDGRVISSNYWLPRRIVVWEQHRGPVPPGHCVIRLVDDVTDDRIENFECITRAALLRLNQMNPIRTLAPDIDLRRAAVAAAVLKTRAFDRERQHEEDTT